MNTDLLSSSSEHTMIIYKHPPEDQAREAFPLIFCVLHCYLFDNLKSALAFCHIPGNVVRVWMKKGLSELAHRAELGSGKSGVGKLMRGEETACLNGRECQITGRWKEKRTECWRTGGFKLFRPMESMIWPKIVRIRYSSKMTQILGSLNCHQAVNQLIPWVSIKRLILSMFCFSFDFFYNRHKSCSQLFGHIGWTHSGRFRWTTI